MCFPGVQSLKFRLKILDVTDILKTSKFEGFDRESRARPFKTTFPCSDFFDFCGRNPDGFLHFME